MRTILSLWKGEMRARESMRDICTAVADAHGMTLEQLRTPTAARRFSWPRQVALTAMHADGWSNAQAAHYVGLRNHTTTVHARRAVAMRASAQRELA